MVWEKDSTLTSDSNMANGPFSIEIEDKSLTKGKDYKLTDTIHSIYRGKIINSSISTISELQAQWMSSEKIKTTNTT